VHQLLSQMVGCASRDKHVADQAPPMGSLAAALADPLPIGSFTTFGVDPLLVNHTSHVTVADLVTQANIWRQLYTYMTHVLGMNFVAAP
jgi:hypothetical protein